MEPTPESSLGIPFFNSVHKTHSTPDVTSLIAFLLVWYILPVDEFFLAGGVE